MAGEGKGKDDGTWEDCGCPLSMVRRMEELVDLVTPIPHMCMISKDELRKHYIFDWPTFVRIQKALVDSPLGRWIAKRRQEERLFVAKPPERTSLPPEPWRYDEPPVEYGPLEPGWRLWQPKDDALNFSDLYPVEEYDNNIETMLEYLNVAEWKKDLLRETAEAWILACGENDEIRVNNRKSLKVDRCFVTSNRDFFAYMMARWNEFDNFLKQLKLGHKMSHMRRLMDIKIDAKICTGGCGHVFNF